MDTHPSRRKQMGLGKGKARQGTAEWARKRTRNIERMMNRNDNIPANIRSEMERELSAHKQTIGDKAFQRKRSAMISKYHMVRFFERKKAARLAKQLRRKLELEEDETKQAELRTELHIAEVDEAYTINYPHVEPYISLYGRSKETSGDDEVEESTTTPAAKAALNQKRPEMWSTIEKAMEQGEGALKRIRESRGASSSAGYAEAANTPNTPHPARAAMIAKSHQDWKPKSQSQNGVQSQLNRRERRKLMRETMATDAKKEDGDNDDGQGFFET